MVPIIRIVLCFWERFPLAVILIKPTFHVYLMPYNLNVFLNCRDNLDPFKMNDDLKIWNALEKCHVKEEVEMAGGLDIVVKEAGMSFSVGQRQLLCLARALLKYSKVRMII